MIGAETSELVAEELDMSGTTMQPSVSQEEILKILVQEHSVISTYILANIKILYSCMIIWGAVLVGLVLLEGTIAKLHSSGAALLYLAGIFAPLGLQLLCASSLKKLRGLRGYKAAIEEKINHVIQEKILHWENSLARKFYHSDRPLALFFLLIILSCIGVELLYTSRLVTLVFDYQWLQAAAIGLLVVAELIVMKWFIDTMKQSRDVEREAKLLYGLGRAKPR